MLFINQRIYSEYELNISEQETLIRFKYDEQWKKNNATVSIYKFDTNYQKRIFISQELCNNQWRWKLPVSYIDNNIGKYTHVIAAVNKISNRRYRKDDAVNVDVLGDNLEFLPIIDGYIDLTLLSKFNKNYINSEPKEYLWLSLVVPKFMFEYPCLLPTDIVHRPYPMNIKPVVTLRNDVPQDVHAGETRKVYIDVDGKIFEPYNGWLQTIRPIVLSDAYKSPLHEPLEKLIAETRNIRDLCTVAADTVELFKEASMEASPDEDKIKGFADKLYQDIVNVKDALYAFYDRRLAERDFVYEYIFTNQFSVAIEDIKSKGMSSTWIDPHAKWEMKIWEVSSPLIYIPRELIMKYSVIETIHGMKRKLVYGNHDKLLNKVRFQRPIEESNFWTFEYDPVNAVWRPFPLKVKHHFPDAYTLTDEMDPTVTPGRVFKAFLFYSDTINTSALTKKLEKPAPQWDKNVFRFYSSARGAYCDLFMEKFYWAGIETLHKDIRMTDNKWELLEYVMNNDYYSRFNTLFMKTIDPYFKLGLATYLRSKDFEFPFDYALDKFTEALNANWDESKKVTNFELYLNNQWIPSYFDILTNILKDFDATGKIIHRAPSSFDIKKVHKTLTEINLDIITSTQSMLEDLNRVLGMLSKENYNLKIHLITSFKDAILKIMSQLESLLDYIRNLDTQTYSIDDLLEIVDRVHEHHELMLDIGEYMKSVRDDVSLNNIYLSKRELLLQVQEAVRALPLKIDAIIDIANNYGVYEFMLAVNDLRTYLTAFRINPEDRSLIGDFNEFRYTWTQRVKETRTRLFVSTAKLIGSYNEKKSYTNEELDDFIKTVKVMEQDIADFKVALHDFYTHREIQPDIQLEGLIENAEQMIEGFNASLNRFNPARNELVLEISSIKRLLELFDKNRFGETEKGYYNSINRNLDDIVKYLSFLSASQKVLEAREAYSDLVIGVDTWLAYVDVEEEVFRLLLDIVTVPSPFLVVMEDRRIILEALMKYLTMVAKPYKPDIKGVNLSEVYDVEAVEILNDGLNYSIGEDLFFPDLGTYEVREIDGKLNVIKAIKAKEYRSTSWKDPLCVQNPFLCVSNRDGIGGIVKPTVVTREVVVDDNAAKSTINRIRQITKSILTNVESPNPFNNAELRTIIESIDKADSRWDDLVSKYSENMTPGIIAKVSVAISAILDCKDIAEEIITDRSKINVREITNRGEKVVTHVTTYAENNNLANAVTYYYAGKVYDVINKIEDFYGDGISWSDGKKLTDLLAELTSAFDFYKANVFVSFPEDKAVHFKNRINEVTTGAFEIQNAIARLNVKKVAIAPFVMEASSIAEAIDINKLYQDKRYRFTMTNVAEKGSGYEVGDIVAIVPELPKDFISDKHKVVGISLDKTELEYTGGNVDISLTMKENVEKYVPISVIPDKKELEPSGGNVNLTINFEKEEKALRVSSITPSTRELDHNGGTVNFVIGFTSNEDMVQPSRIRANPEILPAKGGNVDISIDFKRNPESEILNDVILFQVMEVDETGSVTAVQPMIDYAIPYTIWGIRSTYTLVGKGRNLTLDLYTDEIGYNNSTLINGIIPIINQYGDSDLIAFRFDNIHDLNLSYELYIGGKQITSFIRRHEDFVNPKLPRKVDVIYINANLVMNLRNAAVYIPPEDYYVYRINNINVVDGGRGYCRGQSVFVDVGDFALPLRVSETKYSPYGEIEEIKIADGKIEYEKLNPGKVGAFAIKDDFSNIDDEYSDSDYDNIPREGIEKPLTLSYPNYKFIAEKHDPRESGSRNKIFPHAISTKTDAELGDPDEKWMLGSNLPDTPIQNRVGNLVSPLHPIIPDRVRMPFNVEPLTQYHLFARDRFHNSKELGAIPSAPSLPHTGGAISIYIERNLEYKKIIADKYVETFSDLPRHSVDWPDVKVGSTVIVEKDETHSNRRMIYRVRTFYVTGYLVYNLPEYAEYKHNSIEVDWMNTTWYSDQPDLKQMYSGEHWRTAKSYREIQEMIFDEKLERTAPVPVQIKNRSYISGLTLDDLTVYNLTLKKWENLYDESRWKLEVVNDDVNKKWGFTLTFLPENIYSYDFKLYWNKNISNQLRNALLKRKAELNVESVVIDDISTKPMSVDVNTGKEVRIRKLFPFYQKETFKVGKDENGVKKYDMDFKIAKYIHYRNQLQLADVKAFNKTLNRFENILDTSLFEVRFKSDINNAKGQKETQTTIVKTIVSYCGEGFTDGFAWGYNPEYDMHIFGNITARLDDYGPMLTFTPIHCSKLPTESTMIEFTVFQHDLQTAKHQGSILVEFKTEEVEIWGDGYIHNVTNPKAPLPDEFKIINLDTLDELHEYDIIIDKTAEKWEFIEPKWIMTPTFKIKDKNIQQDRLYIVTEKGRFPLRNPSTGYPTLRVREDHDGTNVTFLNIYRKMEHLQIRSTPYPMRSVYVQRRIPKHGYIDLKGKLNKPLSKKHYEFWMNGRLLNDEVNIITPTKLIMHGLKSLRNFEIIEINRDPHEYFSDLFLGIKEDRLNRFRPNWDYTTYLDRVLEGEYDFTLEEQAALLSPVWPQVPIDHPEYKNYPPNVDIEDDIILRIHTVNDLPIVDLDASSYQFLLHDLPTLEGIVIAGRLNFDQFGLRPLTEHEIIDMLNEEWEEEIRTNPKMHPHTVVNDDEWYGMVAKMYDGRGRETNDIEQALYKVYPEDIVNINSTTKRCRIIRNKPKEYDFK